MRPSDPPRPPARRLSGGEAAVLAAAAHTGDPAARDRLILSYAPMVRYLAVRLADDPACDHQLTDLVRAGLIALSQAVDTARPGRPFEGHAWVRITPAMAACRDQRASA